MLFLPNSNKRPFPHHKNAPLFHYKAKIITNI